METTLKQLQVKATAASALALGIAVLASGCAGEARIALLAPAPAEADAGVVDLPLAGASGAGAVIEILTRPDDVEDQVAVARAPLALRYDFEGVGTVVEDRVGTANGVLRGDTVLDGSGSVTLDGVDDYVDMPNGVLSGRTSVTIMAWLEWRGGPCWQRVFDFGSSDAGEDAVGNATTSLFLTPTSCPDQVLTSMTERASDQESVRAQRALPLDRQSQVALVINGERSEVELYIDGVHEGISITAHAMSDLQDVNNWLGRSQWIQDRYLRARYDELRIYAGALDAAEVRASFERGPDTL